MEDYINFFSDTDWIDANHIFVQKKVFFEGNVFESNITQVAYSELKKDIEITSHIHETMEEVFFLFDGICEFSIQSKTFIATKDSIIRIPANTVHSLKAITNCKFFYFGVSI
jgi:mannose-6-phosphate isomerase-like protein (cupin superfamily)